MSAGIDRFNSFKILAHSDRLRSVAEGGRPFPIDWHIYPSNICNHKCVWCCFRQPAPRSGKIEQFDFAVKLSRDLLLRAVNDAARTGARLVHFSGGGEPLLNRWTAEAAESASSLGLSVALSTNGRRLSPEIARSVDYIRVSLNAGTPEQHWKTNHASDEKDPGDWDAIIENVRVAARCKKQDIGLGFVVDAENWRDIYPFCKIAAETGVDFVHIRPAFYYDQEKDAEIRAIMPDALAESEKAKADWGDKVQVFAITEKFDGYWSDRAYQKCRAIWTGVCLRATGDFAVCQDRTDLTFGNDPSYKEGAAFEDVWFSEERRILAESIVSPGILDSCPRCVWNKRNEIIEKAFVNDDMRLDLV